MATEATHWERERIQLDQEIRSIERERALEQVMLLVHRHRISIDELADIIKRHPAPQTDRHGQGAI